MTELDTIGFGCPHCRTALTVPASASGAKGPCPQCGSVIQAPTFVRVTLPLIVEASLTYPAAVPPERTLAAPVEDALQLPAPDDSNAVIPAAEPPPIAIEEPLQLPAPVDLPDLPNVPEPVREQREPPWRIAIFAGLALLGIGVIIAISLNKNQPATNPPTTAEGPAQKPAIAAEKPAASPPEPVIPRGKDVPALIRESSVVLGEFLGAEDLRFRTLMMETKSPIADLTTGILAAPLPFVKTSEVLGVTFDQEADTADVLFRVDFEPVQGVLDPQLILLRKRGNLEPKIVADPFLDGYGGRLQKFLKAPTFGTQEFQSLITLGGPNSSDGKSPVVVTISRGGRALATAYFPQVSALADKLTALGVKAGDEIPATYTLRWNTTEDPEKPYVELIDVTALKWESR